LSLLPVAVWDIRAVDGTFLRAPLAVRCFLATTVLAALVLPFGLRGLAVTHTKNSLVATLVVLLVLSAVNVELGRLVEGGRSLSHRPHKALSAWAFCSALLLPLPYLLLVVGLSYAHARWRGLRLPLWKWVGSASFVTLAAVPAGAVALRINGGDPNWMNDNGGWGLLATVVGAGLFLAVETLLFHGIAYLNDATDEEWLRRTLASRSFYVTEAAVLLMGALSAAVWTAGAWFLLLLVPVYGLAQRAVLHEPLRRRAETDGKTGLLRFESWRALAVAERERCQDKGRPWSVVFADLDHFKTYNDTHGHLAGDSALLAVATALGQQLRSSDLVGRFGGEEFCVFLPDTPPDQCALIAERLRRAVAECELPEPGTRVTVSLGAVTALPADGDVEFNEALTAADRALMTAKLYGRNRVHCRYPNIDPLEQARNKVLRPDEPVRSTAESR
jgi:diguanylate cyclase (GGDEF)-like protein